MAVTGTIRIGMNVTVDWRLRCGADHTKIKSLPPASSHISTTREETCFEGRFGFSLPTSHKIHAAKACASFAKIDGCVCAKRLQLPSNPIWLHAAGSEWDLFIQELT